MEKAFVDQLPGLLQSCSLPTITDGYFCTNPNEKQKSSVEITTVWAQNSYRTSEKLRFELHYTFSEDQELPLKKISNFPTLAKSVVLNSISPSLTKKALIKKHADATSKKDDFILEIWTQDPPALENSYNLSKYDMHGPVHSDSVFSSFCWSQDELQLLYIAEKKKPKCPTFFERSSPVTSPDEEVKTSEDDNRGEKYDYEENWGELLTEITNPVICVFNLSEESLKILSHVPSDLCPAQPQWGPDNTIVFEGMSKKPFRLGRIACEIRPSVLYHVSDDEKIAISELSEPNVNASRFCQRVSHCKTKVVFLQKNLKPTGTPHRTAESVYVYDFKSKTLQILTPKLNEEEIPVFAHSLPKSCWLDDNVHIVLPLTIKAKTFAAVLNTETGNILNIINCSSVLCVKNNFILMSFMKLNSAHASLILCKFTNGMLSTFSEPQNDDKTLTLGNIPDENGILSHFLMPRNPVEKMPLIINPHGGPHSVYTDNFHRDSRMYAKLGYAVLRVNYRGSTSFTEESLESLPGNVGTQDVNDVQNIALKFIEMYSQHIDRDNIFIFGGSHGGFLGAHLAGQFPDFYRAAALLNPVIDIAAMMMVTDIPDWSYVEGGLPYTQDVLPDPNTYKAMLEKSPIIHLKNVKAPILLLIGGKDARVPPSQGKAYFRLLKANNKITKLLFYPEDSHPLLTVETDGDFVLNVCKWFHKYAQK